MLTSELRHNDMSACDWPTCKRTRFQNHEGVVEHQRAHYTTLLEQLAFARSLLQCGWPGCKSKQKQKPHTVASLKKHLKQHVKAYRCSHPSCGICFSRESDLRRHIQTKHVRECKHLCPIDDCGRHVAGFTRKDKLDDHIKKAHTRFLCPFDHCNLQVLEIDTESHLDEWHRGKCKSATPWLPKEVVYECGLSGCETSVSRFNGLSAKRHLERHHGIHCEHAYGIVRIAHDSGPSNARDNSFILHRQLQRPCTYCAQGSTQKGSHRSLADPPARPSNDINDQITDSIA